MAQDGCTRVLYPAKTTCSARVQTGGVILDLASGQYFGLSPLAARFWEQLCAGKTPAEVIADLSGDMPKEQAASIINDFVTTLRERALVTTEPEQKLEKPDQLSRKRSRSGYSSFWLWLDVGLCMWHVSRALRGSHGLASLIQHVQRLPAQHRAATRRREVERLIAHLQVLAYMVPFSGRCLEQSLALWWLLRARGIEAHLVIGVYAAPFTAHAWVEGDGERLFWQAGLGAYPDLETLNAMTILFHSAHTRL